MKIILIKDDKNLGKNGSIVEVNDGYARNFIIPKKIGIEATAKNINDLKLKNENDKRIAEEKLKEAKEFANDLKDKKIICHIKVGEGGKTFGSISTKEIAKECKAQLGFDIDKKKIQLDESIKTLGTHVVKIKIHLDVVASLNVNVVEEKS